jgi:hypothetical protein
VADGFGGYSPYTGAGNLASAMGANPSFGGWTGGANAYGYAYPYNVGSVGYSSGSSFSPSNPFGGGAGSYADNPAIVAAVARAREQYQPPQFTNTMDPESWNLLAASMRAAQPSNLYAGGTPSMWAGGGGGGFGASAFDQYSMMGAGGYGGGGGNYPAYGVGQGWPQSGSPSNPYGGNTLAALQSGAFGQESGYGTNPAASRMDQWGNVGPMQMNQANMNQYAGGQSVYNPQANMAGGNAMLAGLMQQFGGNPARAYAAYNAGPGFVASGQPWGPQLQSNVGNVLNNMVNYGQGLGWQGQTAQALGRAGVPGMTLNSSGRY